ncbi:hypothetical protein [Nocardiopsis sp. CA-288880]|uniref:hypothetical protein n=1 Tax=Nocardiopsis sp. CA-288880 TaxID=3239995 RepID=UPI003D95290D
MTVSSARLAPGVRSVLHAPRGQRFSHPRLPAASTREELLLAQMGDNPRVAYRQLHGILPAWMEVQHARLSPAAVETRTAAPPPRPRHRSHRKIRGSGSLGLALCCHVLAAALGAFAHHVLSPLL